MPEAGMLRPTVEVRTPMHEPTGPPPVPAAPDAAAMVEVRDLTVDFGGVRAVDHVSFDVPVGTAVGLIGPNGAGKTTAMRAIGGEVKPSRGKVLLGSRDITGGPPHKVARHGLVRTFQLGGEFARLTTMENLLVAVPGLKGTTIWGALAGRRHWGASEAAEVTRARAILARLDLADKENDYAGQLSGGQRKLVEIGRALMARPKMLLLDEPMAGVNRTMARRIEEALGELRAEGLTLLIVEHELASIERLCDRVVVMANGARIAEGDMRDLRAHQEVIDAYLGGGR
ncbi:MAG: ABC transporter ATP-binding protein [Acidimicrobiales bacterium]